MKTDPITGTMSGENAKDEKVRLLVNEEVAQDFYLARLAAPHIAARGTPGQFVEVQVGEQPAPLLRIPLSLRGVDRRAGIVELLYGKVGPKSRALSRMRPETETACLGPLGRGFWPPDRDHRAVLIGGGIGLPPLLFWGEELRSRGYQVALLAGARSAGRHLPEKMLGAAAHKVRRATDDGGLGHCGLVTDLLEEELEKGCSCVVYACGPHGMLAVVAALCSARGITCQVSLEEYMACGIGICVGCVVEVVPEEGEDVSAYGRYRRVCVDGPVFDARRIRWRD